MEAQIQGRAALWVHVWLQKGVTGHCFCGAGQLRWLLSEQHDKNRPISVECMHCRIQVSRIKH